MSPSSSAALMAAVLAVRPRERTALTLAAVAGAWALPTIAVTALGYPAVPRYMVAPAALACVLAGIGASAASRGLLRARTAIPAGVAVLALTLAGFAPPWLSARFVNRAYDAGTVLNARNDLRWARRLDPLSTDPYVAQAELAGSPADIPPLERAVDKEPRREDLRYLLATAYLRAGNKADARAQLREALRLFPGDDLAKSALEKAR